MTTSTKPYLLRALYEWCLDNGLTPHIAVWVNQYTQVPMQHVQDEQIVLNIGPAACKELHIDNDWVHFQARFGGKAEDIWIPVGHVISIFARENSSGMGFEVEAYEPSAEDIFDAATEAGLQVVRTDESPTDDDDKPTPPPAGAGFLKIVK